ncbi:hypothetical protein ACN47E_000566 [Coniothyrium glycines]
MAAPVPVAFGLIKIEDSPEPEVVVTPITSAPSTTNVAAPCDPQDPEGFQRRCSGYNKKTKLRCNHMFGKRAQQNMHPTFLPTCNAHRDQQSFAGWCQLRHSGGDRCGRLFRWTPPYLELCEEHRGHPDTPCYLLKLPLELRYEIFRYLLPTKPIGSSTAILHSQSDEWAPVVGTFGSHVTSTGPPPPSVPVGTTVFNSLGQSVPLPPQYAPRPRRGQPSVVRWSGKSMAPSFESRSWFPVSLLDILLVNHQLYQEIKDLMFSVVTFKIDVRGDGTFMCGRRVLEPRRPDGSSHFNLDEVDAAKERFLKYFDWKAVKNYAVDILLEGAPLPISNSNFWDEEVEIYDIRDYVTVVVSGILAKCQNLCKLQVRVCLDDCDWDEDQILTNTKLIVNPFERLRNVRQPRLAGVFGSGGKYGARAHSNFGDVLCVQHPDGRDAQEPPVVLCSVPKLPTHTILLSPGMHAFERLRTNWERSLLLSGSSSTAQKPPIRRMFTEFKEFYSNLASIVPDVIARTGRHAFLHRARVAREQEDVESFRHLRNELIQYWYVYLEKEERKKNDLNARMSRMLDTDVYPAFEASIEAPVRRRSSAHDDSSSPILSTDTMAREGIPMAANRIDEPKPYAGQDSKLLHMRLQLELLEAKNKVRLLEARQQYAQTQHQALDPAIERQRVPAEQVEPSQHHATHSARAQNQAQVQSSPEHLAPADHNYPNSTETSPYHHPGGAERDTTLLEAISAAQEDLYHKTMYTTPDDAPGPSVKRQRTDSGYQTARDDEQPVYEHPTRPQPAAQETYVGKGKGKMGGGGGGGAAGLAQLICLE